ncbi:universal stress protein [Streptomyces sp. NPDC048288]|uniref:universal stress protein n=1 Tax=Streptomyces sp. NPDC048288 TaxID=3365529 RepID=UPI0037175D2D
MTVVEELPLVVGVDGSEPSLRAVEWAADEAALRGTPLRLVHASLWERYEGISPAGALAEPSEQVMAEDIVEAAARRARGRQPEVKVSSEVLPEEPEYALVRESRDAGLLVLGSRGRHGLTEALLGSVSLTVAAHAHCPVIVLRGDQDTRGGGAGRHGRILLGVGDRREAVRFALREAELRGAELAAVRAWWCPPYETTDLPLLAGAPARAHEQAAAERLAEALGEAPEGLTLRRRTVEGHARQVLSAASRDADLLVVGARRKSGHRGLPLGRTVHDALHHSACPVAVVPEWV